MDLVKISWQGDLNNEQKEILNDMFDIMGLQAAADNGLISQEDVDKEVNRIEEKYSSR